jgi:L-fuculose-phosphate aldolase
MHLVCYRERSDVGAVIHAHPPTATAFAAASTALVELALPEMVVLLGPVALVPYATPGTTNLADQLRSYLANHDAFLLENHGALSVGRDLWDAAQKMELIEQNARITLALRQIGQPFQLSEEQRSELMSIRAQRNAVTSRSKER